jgi:hypothetical protein
MIYHYTKIETLALILEHKTIRFTRLDLVDDPEEFQYSQYDAKPAQNVFVSCWTKESLDTIPQWLIYGANHHGVRIGMPEQMFEIYQKGIYKYICNTGILSDLGCILMPFTDTDYPLYDINYVNDLTENNAKIFNTVNNKSIDYKQLGKYKSSEWAFQKECRYMMNVFPNDSLSKDNNGGMLKLDTTVPMNTRFVDIPIISDFSQMEIMLGANVSEAEILIVESLMQKYLGRTDFKRSRFSDKLAK